MNEENIKYTYECVYEELGRYKFSIYDTIIKFTNESET